jgi:crotonobetainyl-CoA:carnitine CoA-transferase CaiB-like acyl-CoA transferase
MNQGILAGRTVLELGTMLAAPFAAHILAQLGAEVIKIEPPAGDPTRSLVRGGPSGTFIAYSRGKKSLCLDLRREEGQVIFRRLLATADVVLHNLGPDSARRLNVTYDACRQANPQIVYCHIRGYGPGPSENELASNPVAEAATGVMFSHRVDGRPSRLGPSYHDQFAGCYAVIGILGALMNPDGDSESRRLELGLYETGLHVAARDLAGVQLKTHLTGKPEGEPSGEFAMPGYGAYETADGRWLYLVMLNDGHWRKFWEAMAASAACAADPSLETLRQRKKQRARVETLVRDAVGAMTFDGAAARLQAVGVGFTEVLPLDKVLEAPQAREPAKFTSLMFQNFGFEIPDFPLNAGIGAKAPAAPPSLLGAETQEILASLGYSEAERRTLVERGAVVESRSDKPVWAP